jgi:hypothetical protein
VVVGMPMDTVVPKVVEKSPPVVEKSLPPVKLIPLVPVVPHQLLPKSCTHKIRKQFTIEKQYITFIILILEITVHEYCFLIFATLRDLQFHRLCFVTEALKYMYTSAAPVPRTSGKLASCKI